MNNAILFKDRHEAGGRLGEMLRKLSILDPLILGIPRGGIVVAKAVAEHMQASLEVIIARKIVHPRHAEYGIGAVSEDEIPLFTPESVRMVSHTSEQVLEVVSKERAEIRRRISQYRAGRYLPQIKKRNVIVVDDGILSGSTAAAAGKYLRSFRPSRLILAVPFGPVELSPLVKEQYDQIFCLEHIQEVKNVGQYYGDYPEVNDREIVESLKNYYPSEIFHERNL